MRLPTPRRVPCGVVGRELVGVRHCTVDWARYCEIFWHANNWKREHKTKVIRIIFSTVVNIFGSFRKLSRHTMLKNCIHIETVCRTGLKIRTAIQVICQLFGTQFVNHARTFIVHGIYSTKKKCSKNDICMISVKQTCKNFARNCFASEKQQQVVSHKAIICNNVQLTLRPN